VVDDEDRRRFVTTLGEAAVYAGREVHSYCLMRNHFHLVIEGTGQTLLSFPRQASGHGAQVLIGGRRCPVLGRVTMDQILADVSEVPFAKEGDEAVLVGGQGCEEIRARELAECASTISWDIFTGIKARVKRFVV